MRLDAESDLDPGEFTRLNANVSQTKWKNLRVFSTARILQETASLDENKR